MQGNLFGKTHPMGVSIEEAAATAKVSPATIRNWVKTGYLHQVSANQIDKASLDQFMQEVAGKEKLTRRANKLMKDAHDHNALSELVINKIKNNEWFDISEKYEQSLSDSYRNKEGIYYTPSAVVEDMLRDVALDSNTTFLDPCCGSGNFVIEAIKKGAAPKNVFGFDVDPNAVEITKKRIWEQNGYDATNNVLRLDFLENAYKLSKQRQYDLIFTNPPWGKKLRKKEKDRFARLYNTGKSQDTTSLFYFAAMQLLKDEGCLGFLVQEALFNIATFQNTREHLLKNNVLRLVDYDKPFKGLVTKAQAFIIEKSEQVKAPTVCQTLYRCYTRHQETFQTNPKQILNFWADQEDANVIRHVGRLSHQTLAGRAKWALGIVTGNNAKFCKNNPIKGHIPVYKGSDITPDGLKEASNYIPADFTKYQQVAPMSMYKASEKLIYKFISSKLLFFYDTEQRLVLNSANVMIPDRSLGVSCRELAKLLSSDFVNWLFQAIFKTHKILRGDLEQLPIHTAYFQQYASFSEEMYIDYLGLIKQENGTYRKAAKCK